MEGVVRQPEQHRRRPGQRGEIGKSTAGKILAKRQKDDSVTRTPGIGEGGRRAADLWAITDTTIDVHVDTDSTEHTPTGDVPVGDADSVDTEQVDATVPESTDVETSGGGPTEPTDTTADHAPDATDTGETDPTNAEPVVAESTQPTAASAATDGDTEPEDNNRDGKKTRLAPGALRGMVEGHLRDHPGVRPHRDRHSTGREVRGRGQQRAGQTGRRRHGREDPGVPEALRARPDGAIGCLHSHEMTRAPCGRCGIGVQTDHRWDATTFAVACVFGAVGGSLRGRHPNLTPASKPSTANT